MHSITDLYSPALYCCLKLGESVVDRVECDEEKYLYEDNLDIVKSESVRLRPSYLYTCVLGPQTLPKTYDTMLTDVCAD